MSNQKQRPGLRGALDTYPLTKLTLVIGLLIAAIVAVFDTTAATWIGTTVLTFALILGVTMKA